MRAAAGTMCAMFAGLLDSPVVSRKAEDQVMLPKRIPPRSWCSTQVATREIVSRNNPDQCVFLIDIGDIVEMVGL